MSERTVTGVKFREKVRQGAGNAADAFRLLIELEETERCFQASTDSYERTIRELREQMQK